MARLFCVLEMDVACVSKSSRKPSGRVQIFSIQQHVGVHRGEKETSTLLILAV